MFRAEHWYSNHRRISRQPLVLVYRKPIPPYDDGRIARLIRMVTDADPMAPFGNGGILSLPSRGNRYHRMLRVAGPIAPIGDGSVLCLLSRRNRYGHMLTVDSSV